MREPTKLDKFLARLDESMRPEDLIVCISVAIILAIVFFTY